MKQHSENKTLGERAAEEMIELIQKKGFQVGDKLPTEIELAEILGVSRNTVREALRVLVSKNMVVIRQGSGTFISEKKGIVDDPFGFSLIGDRRKLTEDLLQIRTIIEPAIAALAAQNATEEEISELERILLEVEALIEKEESYSEKDVEFHVQIAKCSHNMVMPNLLPVIRNGVSVFAKEVQEQEYKQTRISHRNIFDAIKNKKPVEAEKEMQFHILYNNNRYHQEIVSDKI